MRTTLFALALIAAPVSAAGDFAYTQRVGAGDTVIDSRPLADCKRASLPGARCLPAEDFLGPSRQLPSERNILWLLGTAGLDGSESVLVVGQNETDRDFVAGLLYLAGQKSVRILSVPPRIQGTVSGAERGMVRSAVWTAPMRDHLWVLGADILRSKPALIDARQAGPMPSPSAGVVIADDAWQAIARFTQLRAGRGFAVRVHPGGLAMAAGRAR
ncbi:MAG: rhodanese-like domain-containing protein [Sulfuritalea sp.]|nr:rhodanese-like domain-containing protein [Sulfuritalea sp.]